MLFDDKLARMHEQQRQIRDEKENGAWAAKLRDLEKEMTDEQREELKASLQTIEEKALADEMDSKDRTAIILAAYRVILPAVIVVLVLMLGLTYVMFSWPRWVN